jgi:hypothetical protein
MFRRRNKPPHHLGNWFMFVIVMWIMYFVKQWLELWTDPIVELNFLIEKVKSHENVSAAY